MLNVQCSIANSPPAPSASWRTLRREGVAQAASFLNFIQNVFEESKNML
jgi:hypothetical protein